MATNTSIQMPGYSQPLAWLIGGIILTLGSYLAAPPGSTFLIFYGAIAWGAWSLFKTWQARRAWFNLLR